MRYLLLTLALVLAIGCGTANPTSPDLTDVYEDYPVPSSMDNYLARGAQDYDPMPPGWVPDGTLMSDNELLIYFSAHIAEDILGGMEHPAFCNVYDALYQYFWSANQYYPEPYTFMRFMAWLMESNGYDVPDERDIFPPCA